MTNPGKIVAAIAEAILILAAVTAAVCYFTLSPQSFVSSAQKGAAAGGASPAAEVPEDRGQKELSDAPPVSAAKLRRIFFYEKREAAPVTQSPPEQAPELELPKISYAGMVRIDDNAATYLFTIDSRSRPVSLKLNETAEGLQLTGVKKAPGKTVFTFLYKGEEITVSDKD